LIQGLVGWSWVFEQIQIIDYGKNIFSLVVKIASLRIMITLVGTRNLHIHQMDAKITFLNGTLNEKNYISQFEGFNCSSKSPKEAIDFSKHYENKRVFCNWPCNSVFQLQWPFTTHKMYTL
jgi:hypothetical protein